MNYSPRGHKRVRHDLAAEQQVVENLSEEISIGILHINIYISLYVHIYAYIFSNKLRLVSKEKIVKLRNESKQTKKEFPHAHPSQLFIVFELFYNSLQL